MPQPVDAEQPAAGESPAAGDVDDTVLTTDLTQGVGATAEARQSGATNTSIVVRSDAPGDDGPVSQANTAGATASGSAIGTTAGNAGIADARTPSSHVSQDVQAGAFATQSGVANTNISVRVGSAGDSGIVSQANRATATAAAQASDTTAATRAQSTARQDGAANANVSVRVFSPGDDGAVTQANAASASATAVDATAQAEQTGVSNTNVSIRIESPGSEGGATQGSSSETATDGPESAKKAAKILDVENHDGNTEVRIRVNGPDLADPTSNSAGLVSVWRWTWQWEHDEALGLPFDLDQAGSGWNWNWTGDGASVTSVPLTPDLTPGTFVWSWDWERDVDRTWTWDLSAPLSCSCIWIWNWTWTWNGSSADADGTAPAAPAVASTAVEQQNIAAAVAEASVLADVSQASTNDDDPGTSFAGQLVDLTQFAGADASATQSGTLNELGAAGRQANVARVDALASGDAFVTQELVQAGGGTEGTSQWAGQQVGLGQLLVAQAAASQSDAQNRGSSQTTPAIASTAVASTAVEQQNIAAAVAEASVLADVSQASTNDDDPGTSFAGQLVDLTQFAGADAFAAQSGTLNELWGAGKQANVARVDALASGDASVTQELVQARGGPEETSQWAGQQVGLEQLLVAQAVAAQSDAQNLGSSQTTLAAADAGALALAETSQQLDQLGLSLGGTQDQWAGQQTSLVQMAGGVALAEQSGVRGGASALASTSAADTANTIQGAEQRAIGGFGLRSQRSAQLAVVNQLGTSTATTTDSTSGHTNREASSKAITPNAGLVEQRAVQELTEGSLISIQDSTQQTLLVQVASAYSPSLGGKAGTATVLNCATVGQASGQGMGGPVVVGTTDHSTFCFPPEPSAPAQRGEEGQTAGAAIQAATIVQPSVVLAAELDLEPRRPLGVYVRVYVGVDRGARPKLSGRGRGSAPAARRQRPTALLAPSLGAFAPVPRTPQISAAIVSAPPSGHNSSAAVRDHTEQPLQWPRGLLPEVGSASSIVPGGGGMAATIAAFLPAVSTSGRVVAGSVVRRPTHFALMLERPG